MNALKKFLGAAIVLVLALAVNVAAQQPAEQVYKNIQALKGVPADQITPTMRVIARDLGVTCNFCHEEEDRAADTMEAKETARSMIAMMNGINKANFAGRQEVTCFTCHHGVSDPTNIPTLPAFEVAMIGPGDDVKPPTLPSIDEVLGKFVQALGGEQAIRKINSMVVTGKRTAYGAPGRDGPGPATIEMYRKAPNLSVTVTRAGNNTTSTGFDGTAAWAQNAQGRVNQLNGPAADRAKRDADIYWPVDLKQQYQRLTVRDITMIGDKQVYEVAAVAQGNLPERYYFDTKTGLLLRHQYLGTSAVGNVPYSTDYDDYRDAGNGVKVPYVINIVGPSRPDCASIAVEKVQINTAIDNSKFAKPESKTP